MFKKIDMHPGWGQNIAFNPAFSYVTRIVIKEFVNVVFKIFAYVIRMNVLYIEIDPCA